MLLLAAAGGTWAQEATAPPEHQAEAVQDQQVSLFVLNISGPTLFASNQEITDNGKDLVSLPRNSYKGLTITPNLRARQQ